MTKRFNYRTDRRSKRITWAVVILAILATAYASYYYFNIGAYYPAWFVTFLLAVAALYILSIPRSIRLTDEALEIHCIVELVTVKLEDIESVSLVENDRPHLFLLLGSYGFFGYYGYYLDYRNWEIVKVYASQWKNFLEVEDIYEQRYIISCEDPHELLCLLEKSEVDSPAV